MSFYLVIAGAMTNTLNYVYIYNYIYTISESWLVGTTGYNKSVLWSCLMTIHSPHGNPLSIMIPTNPGSLTPHIKPWTEMFSTDLTYEDHDVQYLSVGKAYSKLGFKIAIEQLITIFNSKGCLRFFHHNLTQCQSVSLHVVQKASSGRHRHRHNNRLCS
jgi:hypothetical protein